MSGRSESGYLSTKKASKALGVGRAALYRWARMGKIDHYQTPGGHFRWNVAGYLAGQAKVADRPAGELQAEI